MLQQQQACPCPAIVLKALRRGRPSPQRRCIAGELLCFVHADSRPPLSLIASVRRALADPAVVLGGFRVIITDPGSGGLMRFQTAHHWAKTYYMPALLMPLRFWRCALGRAVGTPARRAPELG